MGPHRFYPQAWVLSLEPGAITDENNPGQGIVPTAEASPGWQLPFGDGRIEGFMVNVAIDES